MYKSPFDAKPYRSNPKEFLKNVEPVVPEISSVRLLPICETPMMLEWWMEWNARRNCHINCMDPLHNHEDTLNLTLDQVAFSPLFVKAVALPQ
jgi:hypothetical protein